MLEILIQQNGVNKLIDTYPDETFTANYSIADINDIADSGGAYTKTIKIPDTSNNRQIFGFVTDFAVDLGYNYYQSATFSYNPNKRVACSVLEDTLVIMEGYIQLTKFNLEVNAIKSIECVIYADNANFYQSLGNALLTDLDFSEFGFSYSTDFVTSTWNNDSNAYSKAVYFPLVDNGNGWTLDDLNNSTLFRLGLKDFKPAIFVKTIWDKIFATHSYYVNSNFTSTDSRFTNLVIPYNSLTFQTSADRVNNLRFLVGLTATTIGQYTTFSFGQYDYFRDMTLGGGWHNAWYNGYMLSPFNFYFDRNNGLSSSTFTYDQQVLPFGNTASPMFDPVIGGQPMFDTSVPADNLYINTTGSIYKQRFVLKTDLVTTWSNNGGFNESVRYFTASFGSNLPTPPELRYAAYVNFFREVDPVTGTTSVDWLSGTGAIIPPDLGFQTSGVSYSIAQSFDRHWICDEFGASNCFDSSGKLIVPMGDGRYLGKYCTDYTGGKAIEADGSDGGIWASQSFYKNESGNCKSWYYNDGWTSTEIGLWTSGDMPFYNNSTDTTRNGDWYQQLQLQTIYLDGDETDQFYGATGSVSPFGNTPLFPGEHVRCVAFFGGKWGGQATGTARYLSSLIPPTSGYLLTYTNFYNDAPFPYGSYQNPQSRNQPLTLFYNDVSADYIKGMWVDANDIVPKNVKQSDFIMDIVNLHNLYIEPDKNNRNTLTIEPREDYYALATQSLDWTAKVDLNDTVEVQILGETQNKSTLFTYKADKDWWNKQYTQLTNEIYGQFRYTIDNDFLSDEKKIEIQFSPTPLVQLFSYVAESGGDSLTSTGGFIIPVLVSGTNQKPSTTENANGTTQYNYRILYKNYLENQNTDQINLFGSFTHSYPYAGPYDNPYNPNYALNFGQTLGEFFDESTDSFPNNLVNSYWATLLTELTDMDSRIITLSMYLTPYDINQFTFNKIVYLELDGVGCYYKVNSIEDYTPGQSTTCKVTLLKSNVS